VRILWDEPKRRTTLARRGLDFANIEPQFFEAATVTPARGGRFRAVGYAAGRIVVVIFARLGSEAISVISMRLASRKERLTHETEGPTADR
jgi:uncharacterized DUF497 family protein